MPKKTLLIPMKEGASQKKWTKQEIKIIAKRLYLETIGRTDKEIFEKIVKEFEKNGVPISVKTLIRYKQNENWVRINNGQNSKKNVHDDPKKNGQKNEIQTLITDRKNKTSRDEIETAKNILDLYLMNEKSIVDCCLAYKVPYRTFMNWVQNIAEVADMYDATKEQMRLIDFEILMYSKKKYLQAKLINPIVQRTTIMSDVVQLINPDTSLTEIKNVPKKHIKTNQEITPTELMLIMEKYEQLLTLQKGDIASDKTAEQMTEKELSEHIKRLTESDWNENMPTYE